MSEQRFSLNLRLRKGYEFTVDFDQPDLPKFVLDEPPPLGEGRGPNPARLLGAAIGDCLSASLLYCLRKARIPVSDLQTRVEGTLVRNAQGKLRIGNVTVHLSPEVPADKVEQIGRCASLFEDFCVVTQSVREGLDVRVELEPAVVTSV